MTEFPISEEALDAVAQIIYDRKVASVVFDGDVKAVINTFLEKEKFQVQHDEELLASEIRPVERLVGPWRPSEGQ